MLRSGRAPRRRPQAPRPCAAAAHAHSAAVARTGATAWSCAAAAALRFYRDGTDRCPDAADDRAARRSTSSSASYNYARYLPAAIDSALAQTHPDVRVIVVDDGSTDGSPRGRSRPTATRIDAILKENGGQASAFNAALRGVRGRRRHLPRRRRRARARHRRRRASRRVWRPTRRSRRSSGGWTVDRRRRAPDRRDAAAAGPAAAAGRPARRRARVPVRPDLDGDERATRSRAPCSSGSCRCPSAPYRVNADWYLQHLTPLLGPVRSLDEAALAAARPRRQRLRVATTADARPRPRCATTIVDRRDTRGAIERARRRARAGARARAAAVRLRPGQPADLAAPRAARHPVAGDTRRRPRPRLALRAAGTAPSTPRGPSCARRSPAGSPRWRSRRAPLARAPRHVVRVPRAASRPQPCRPAAGGTR